MFAGVEPIEEVPDEGGNRDGNIRAFMQPEDPKWSKEGLLEHLIELVVVEDKVRSLFTVNSICISDFSSSGFHNCGEECVSPRAQIPAPPNERLRHSVSYQTP